MKAVVGSLFLKLATQSAGHPLILSQFNIFEERQGSSQRWGPFFHLAFFPCWFLIPRSRNLEKRR